MWQTQANLNGCEASACRSMATWRCGRRRRRRGQVLGEDAFIVTAVMHLRFLRAAR
ncbi:hypothetical protein [Mycolicibacterium sphagni]|uniref:hypothetical protein n=1 Tax=Mycolicibacterium sphagni TaxID=1786 RepID=UPI00157646A0|nr:hypothetical protein [Mycolicibacterium sphagni]